MPLPFNSTSSSTTPSMAMNVLVYSGRGVSQECLYHTLFSLRRSLGHAYAVRPVTAALLQGEPWEESCALLVIPGGRATPYVEDLKGRARERIINYVLKGPAGMTNGEYIGGNKDRKYERGRLLGICAGAYFCSSAVRFEMGTSEQVSNDLHLLPSGHDKFNSSCLTSGSILGIFPGLAIGSVYPGYSSADDAESGARLATITPVKHTKEIDQQIKAYFNGGCKFVLSKEEKSNEDASIRVDPRFSDGWQFDVLAYYEGGQNAAIVGGLPHKNINNPMEDIGIPTTYSVILSGIHLEFDEEQFCKRKPNHPLRESFNKEGMENGRKLFWNHLLTLLGLDVALNSTTIKKLVNDVTQETHGKTISGPPEKTPLHLYSLTQSNISKKLESEFKDTLKKYPIFIHTDMSNAKSDIALKEAYITEKWSFNPSLYRQYWLENSSMRAKNNHSGSTVIGNTILYAECLDSTQTLIQQNPSLATSLLPNGTIVLAGEQLAGKGRGDNVWVSSKGCLQFTLLLRHADGSTLSLLQYLTALAMTMAIVEDPGAEKLPVKIKWPNDLYTYSPSESSYTGASLKKLAGILVNSQTIISIDEEDIGQFVLLIGMGTNVYDTPWTRSINDLINEWNMSPSNCSDSPPLSLFSKEKLLARFAHQFSHLYDEMLRTGKFPFELYYRYWMHNGQEVFLETEQKRVRIEGIDNFGYLVVRTINQGMAINNNGKFGGFHNNKDEVGLQTLIQDYERTHDGSRRGSIIKLGENKSHGIGIRGTDDQGEDVFLLQPDGNSFDMMKGLIKRK